MSILVAIPLAFVVLAAIQLAAALVVYRIVCRRDDRATAAQEAAVSDGAEAFLIDRSTTT